MFSDAILGRSDGEFWLNTAIRGGTDTSNGGTDAAGYISSDVSSIAETSLPKVYKDVHFWQGDAADAPHIFKRKLPSFRTKFSENFAPFVLEERQPHQANQRNTAEK